MTFSLHPQLAKDCTLLGDLPLCKALLMNNQHFPWLILVPRRLGLRELFDLKPEDYRLAMDETRFAAKQLSELTGAYKMNVAALGNQVPQLHIHVIARSQSDAAWPNPVWATKPEAYAPEAAAKMAQNVRKILGFL